MIVVTPLHKPPEGLSFFCPIVVSRSGKRNYPLCALFVSVVRIY